MVTYHPYVDVLWYSPQDNFTSCVQGINHEIVCENQTFKIITTSPRGQCVKDLAGSYSLEHSIYEIIPVSHHTLVYYVFKSMWPSDATGRHRTGSTLAQVMACCLTAPSHYLNQCWLIISKAQCYSSEGNSMKGTSAIKHKIIAWKLLIKISFKSPSGQWVKFIICLLSWCYPHFYVVLTHNFYHNLK